MLKEAFRDLEEKLPDAVRSFYGDRLDVLDLLYGKRAYSSKALRKERELAFYGDIDFIPTEEYKEGDAREAIENTRFVVVVVEKAFETGR